MEYLTRRTYLASQASATSVKVPVALIVLDVQAASKSAMNTIATAPELDRCPTWVAPLLRLTGYLSSRSKRPQESLDGGKALRVAKPEDLPLRVAERN